MSDRSSGKRSGRLSRWLFHLENRYQDRWSLLVFCTVIAVAACSFGVFALFDKDFFRSGLLLVIAVSLLLVLRCSLKGYSESQLRIACAVISSVLFFYLLISGGYAGVGPVWCVALGVVVLLLLGEKWGGLFFIGLLMSVALLLQTSLIDHQITDPVAYKNRFAMILLVVGTYIWLHQYSHARTMDRLKKTQQALARQASTDVLTGLSNRRDMLRHLSYQERRSERVQESYGLVVADIDHFKRINDSYGHHCGDQVICQVARLLENHLREQDIVARWGGEEFLYFVENISRQELKNKLRLMLESTAGLNIGFHGQSIGVTLSIGYLHLMPSAEVKQVPSWEELLIYADAALYFSKREGRDRVTGILSNFKALHRVGYQLNDICEAINSRQLSPVKILRPVVKP